MNLMGGGEAMLKEFEEQRETESSVGKMVQWVKNLPHKGEPEFKSPKPTKTGMAHL